MPKISAIIHVCNDAVRLGRAIESLRPCDEVIVVDHASTDASAKVAREHGASVKAGVPGVEPGAYIVDAHHDWIFCLQPNESMNEALEAALNEWKHGDPAEEIVGYRMGLRAEQNGGWQDLPAEMRLVNRKRLNWSGELPPTRDDAPELAGELMRFATP